MQTAPSPFNSVPAPSSTLQTNEKHTLTLNLTLQLVLGLNHLPHSLLRLLLQLLDPAGLADCVVPLSERLLLVPVGLVHVLLELLQPLLDGLLLELQLRDPLSHGILRRAARAVTAAHARDLGLQRAHLPLERVALGADPLAGLLLHVQRNRGLLVLGRHVRDLLLTLPHQLLEGLQPLDQFLTLLDE